MTQNTDENEAGFIRGVVQRITFRNQENGYTVLKMEEEVSGELTTVVGNLLHIENNQEVLFRGFYSKHPNYGRQFSAQSGQVLLPETEAGITRFLASGIVKGIGQKTAKRIVEAFGIDSIKTIKEDKKRVAAIQGVGKSRAKLLADYFSNLQYRAEIDRFFLEKGFSANLVAKIFKKYGEDSIEIVSANPYKLTEDIEGIGFKTADKFAFSLGFDQSSDVRIRAGIIFSLSEAARDGHCCLDAPKLLSYSNRILGEIDPELFTESLNFLIDSKQIIFSLESYYLPYLFLAEEYVSDFIANRCHQKIQSFAHSRGKKLEPTLNSIEQDFDINFNIMQKKALKLAFEKPLSIITGGPGCGKTTCIRAIASLAKKLKLNFALAAPTGKAAQRITQVCEHPASTIHRLLKFNPFTRNFEYGINNPLKAPLDSRKDLDLLVIDEASMIDISLAKNLFSAVSPKTALVLIGDKDQLPSVGPGKLFADLVAMDGITVVSLNQLYRRSESSSINSIAHDINSGQIPQIPVPDGETKSDAYFIQKNDQEETASLVQSLFLEQIPKKFGFSSQDISILTPGNKGVLGTQGLNEAIQAKLFNKGQDQFLSRGDKVYFKGDRICQRVNNYQIDPQGVFNGDIGYIEDINKKDATAQIRFWDGRLVEYAQKELDQISLAYATTVHRSQGSEIPCVVIVLNDRAHYILLESQLLYTAVTRAKELLIILGTKKALAISCRRKRQLQRMTQLKKRVLELESLPHKKISFRL